MKYVVVDLIRSHSSLASQLVGCGHDQLVVSLFNIRGKVINAETIINKYFPTQRPNLNPTSYGWEV